MNTNLHDTQPATGEEIADAFYKPVGGLVSDQVRKTELAGMINTALAAERDETKEARAQRDWLIKECARVGVTVNVRIGAPLTEAYSLVNPHQK